MFTVTNSLIPFRGYKAMAIWPVIFVRKNVPMRMQDYTHEYIHARQQIELLIVGFYVCYLAEYLYYLIKLRSSHKAYRSISFEREAYIHQSTPTYLFQRKLFAMWRTHYY